jgi:hypothetical protein
VIKIILFILAIAEDQWRRRQGFQSKWLNRFGQFALFTAKHDFAFQTLKFVLQLLQFPACFSNITYYPVCVMTVIYINHCKESQEKEKRKIVNHPLIANQALCLVFFPSEDFHSSSVMDEKLGYDYHTEIS